MGQNSFNEFLKYTLSQKEVSLAMAQDDAELNRFVEILQSNRFRQAIDTTELFKYITTLSKVFFIVRGSLEKDVYDFIVQYPTGQIEIFDKQSLKSRIATPVYDGVSVIFLITKPVLRQIQKTGLQMLNYVGVTYQS